MFSCYSLVDFSPVNIEINPYSKRNVLNAPNAIVQIINFSIDD